jgi:hypothetical protein
MRELKPLTPPSLERLVKTCVAKDPDERWQNAHDVAAQLRGIVRPTGRGRDDRWTRLAESRPGNRRGPGRAARGRPHVARPRPRRRADAGQSAGCRSCPLHARSGSLRVAQLVAGREAGRVRLEPGRQLRDLRAPRGRGAGGEGHRASLRGRPAGVFSRRALDRLRLDPVLPDRSHPRGPDDRTGVQGLRRRFVDDAGSGWCRPPRRLGRQLPHVAPGRPGHPVRERTRGRAQLARGGARRDGVARSTEERGFPLGDHEAAILARRRLDHLRREGRNRLRLASQGRRAP